jgi:phosphoribosylamine--glycine ligase
MGAHTLADPQVEEFAMDQIILPTLYAMAKGDRPFTGILYAGLMLTEDGPKLIEYNVRLGDPEWQAMAMCFDDDLYWIFDEVSHGTMPILEKPQRMGIAVVMTAPGYPVEPQTGSEIRSIDVPDGTMVFHAGTARTPGGRLIASGGRVLNVCTSADDLPTARERVYAGVAHIDWQEGYYRHDIGVLNYQLEVATADADAIP